MGFKPNIILSALEVPKNDVDYEIARKNYQAEAKAAVDFAADVAKIRFDKTRNPAEFRIGDEVYLKLHHKLPGYPPRKRSQQRVGPFTIVKRLDNLIIRSGSD